MYAVLTGPKTRRFLKKCEKQLRKRIFEKMNALEKEPFPKEVERVKSLQGKPAFRVRVGEYRIQYVVYQTEKNILVFNIDKRGRVYK